MEGAGVKVTCLDMLERTLISSRLDWVQNYQTPFIFFLSCLALNDLIRGRQSDEIINRLSEIWETLFRVLDDIKVRNKKLFYVLQCFVYALLVTYSYIYLTVLFVSCCRSQFVRQQI